MPEGIIPVTFIAVRREPDDRSEMVNQLLLGETYTTIQSIGSWIEIRAHPDDEQGWIHRSSFLEYTGIENGESGQKKIVSRLLQARKKGSQYPTMWIMPGSELSLYDPSDLSFSTGTDVYCLEEEPADPPSGSQRDTITWLGKMYLNVPFLWGGRSMSGIDAPGLVQVVYKLAGIMLPRRISAQLEQGLVVPFISDARPGDLAFFENERGLVDHVGILVDGQNILHPSGCVRLDPVDHQGIRGFGQDTYTHRLRVIKSYL